MTRYLPLRAIGTMPSSKGDIATALSSGSSATDATLRIVTEAGREGAMEGPVPSTHVCKYMPSPGGAVGYKITLCTDVFGTRADTWLRGGEGREEGREGGRERWCSGRNMGSVPASPPASC